jgi:hypothetical protein
MKVSRSFFIGSKLIFGGINGFELYNEIKPIVDVSDAFNMNNFKVSVSSFIFNIMNVFGLV